MKRSIAWILALVMLFAVMPDASAATREPKLKVNTAQLTANTEAPNRFEPLSDFVEEYPYWVQPTFRTYGMSVVAGRTMELSAEFYCENLKKTDIIGVMIFKGRYDEIAADAEPVATIAEYATPMSYSYTYYYSWDTTGMEKGDYTAYFVVVSEGGELLTANAADIYVSDVEIPVTGLEIYVHQMDDTPDLIALQSYGGFDMDIIYEPYHTTSPRKAAVLDGWGVAFDSTEQVGAGWGCSAYRLDEKDGYLVMGYKEDVPGVTETPTDRMEIVLREAEQMADLQGNVKVCIGGTKEYSVVLPEGTESFTMHNSNPYLLEIVDYADGVVTVRGLGTGDVTLSAIYDNGIDMHHLNVRAHDYLEHWRNAMCEEDGLQWWECRNCGHVKDERVLPATGCIILGSHRVVTPPKATKEGVGEGYCTVCGKAGPYPLDPIFSDTQPDRFYSEAVDYCYANGIIKGITASTFEPNTGLTRGQLVTMLYRHAGAPEVEESASFADVPEGKYYSMAVAWASANSIVNGYAADNTFRPDVAVDRAQLVTMIHRYVKFLEKDHGERSDLSGFADLAELPNYAGEAMAWAVATGVVKGVSADALGSGQNATRAQTATIVHRVITDILEG